MRMYWDGRFMSADKKPKKRSTDTTISGLVVQKAFARGSKSEHNALYIDCGDHEYILRRLNANPFQDDLLLSFKGKTVVAKGVLTNNTFLAKEIEEKI